MTATGKRAAAGELAETRLVVNGEPVVLRLPPRVTLADALREHLQLTGTHLGCEHGVCGMCTVLVDGAAARSCLLFACQLDGAEVVTVEGLGRPGDLHPLQEAFGRHHALQCGFCTPGFLLSAYDLLSHRPDVSRVALPTELSGVLCRCTGYRNILAAVEEVATRYAGGGLPGPGNCGLSGGATRMPPARAATTGTDPTAESEGPAAAAPAGGRQPTTIGPAGPPTFSVEVTRELTVPVAAVWPVLADMSTFARCLPGAELTGQLDPDRYRGRVRFAAGPVQRSYQGTVAVVERDDRDHMLRVLARGAADRGERPQVDIRLRAVPSGLAPRRTVFGRARRRAAAPAGATPAGCALTVTARVHLTGRVAPLARGMAGEVARRLFDQFADAVAAAAAETRVRHVDPDR